MAESDRFVLVDREKVEHVLREQELSGAGLELGRIVGADGVLFMDSDSGVVHVALVETVRGAHLFDYARQTEGMDIEATASLIRKAVDEMADELVTPPERRLYVGLPPFDCDSDSGISAEWLACVHALAAAELSARRRVILVERQHLGDVAAEKSNRNDQGRLAEADIFVRARAVRSAKDGPVLEMKLARGKKTKAARIELRMDDPGAAAKSVVTRVLELASYQGGPDDRAPRGEAELNHATSVALALHKNYPPALRHALVAYALEPENRERIEWLADTIAAYLEQRRADFRSRAPVFDADEYMAALAWLEQALRFDRILNADRARPPLRVKNGKAFFFLLNPPPDMTEEQRLMDRRVRTEFLRHLEWCAYLEDGSVNHDNRALVGGLAPLCFTEVEPAMAYMKAFMERPDYSWRNPGGSIFPDINYWDREKARKLWCDFMEETLAKNTNDQAQLAALGVLCLRNGSFNGPRSPPRDLERARACSRRLLEWIEAKPERVDWYMAEGNRVTAAPLFEAVRWLPLEEQTAWYRSTGLRILGSEAFYYLGERYYRWQRGQQADDKEVIRALLVETMAEVRARNSPVSQVSEQQEWYMDLMGRDPSIDYFPEPENVGTCLFDSASYYGDIIEPAGRYFDTFGGSVVDGALWLGWSQSNTAHVVRLDLSSTNVAVFRMPGYEEGALWRVEQPLFCRVGSHLCAATGNGLYAFPISDSPPYADMSKVTRLGIGSNLNISALVPAGDRVFIGINAPFADGKMRNRYGAIYTWSPPDSEMKLFATSDSLSDGPLNDCLPYALIGGYAQDAQTAVYFIVSGYDGQASSRSDGQRQGVWRYAPKDNTWQDVEDQPVASVAFPASTPHLQGRKYVIGLKVRFHAVFDLDSLTIDNMFGVVPVERHGAFVDWMVEARGGQSSRVYSLYRPNEYGRELFAVPEHPFQTTSLLVHGDRLIVCLAVLSKLTFKPTDRGLVYSVPLDDVFKKKP